MRATRSARHRDQTPSMTPPGHVHVPHSARSLTFLLTYQHLSCSDFCTLPSSVCLCFHFLLPNSFCNLSPVHNFVNSRPTVNNCWASAYPCSQWLPCHHGTLQKADGGLTTSGAARAQHILHDPACVHLKCLPETRCVIMSLRIQGGRTSSLHGSCIWKMA